MPDPKKKMGRAEERAAIRRHLGPNVKPWPMGLQTNVARIMQIAADEWNFERFYAKVQPFAGGTVTRELLQEFMKAKQITLKTRPRDGGRLV
jgi:hypothetical protein